MEGRITAREAKDAADSITNTKHSLTLADIYTKIRRASSKGEHDITYTGDISTTVSKQLKDDGYTVTFYDGDPRDYDPGYWSIKW
jgi:hypothetical protein